MSSAPHSARRVAVIGAGIAGLSAAEALADAGLSVVVFDKGRGPAGRASTRRADPFAFDHGAQYFTARDPVFRQVVDEWVWEGAAAPWTGRLAATDGAGLRPLEGDTERFVGTPSMSAVARHLARRVDVRTGVRIARLEGEGRAWTLALDEGGSRGPFDAVLVTAPAPQAAALVEPAPALAALAASVEMVPCWAAMVAFDAPYPLTLEGAPVDGLFVNAGPLSWAARDSSKPGRPPGDAWVLHAGPAWTRAHLDLPRGEVARRLVTALEDATGARAPAQVHADAHRWMHSAAAKPLEVEAAHDADLGLGLAGDWLCGAKVQGAWRSGRALAARVLAAHSTHDSTDAD